MTREERVPSVIDGDTSVTGSRKNPVRIANVNAPKKGTRGAGAATQALRNFFLGQAVSVETVARYKHGRSVANIKVENRSGNAAMRRKGYK